MFVLIGGWLITGGVIPSVAAKNDACRVGCKTEKQACRDAYQGAFQTTKSDCTGSGKAKRQCVKTARSVLRAGVKKCRGFAATCLACCKAGGTNCNVQCGDGVMSGGESCDPPGTSGCAGGGKCDESCRCPSSFTTTSLITGTTSAPSTTTTRSSSSSTSTTTQPSCSNGSKDGNETAVDCGGGTCAPCADGLACAKGGDCRSRFCSGDHVCTDPCPTQPAGTPCAEDGNSCTDDACDGSTCQHTPLDGTICRRATGPCDAAEVCDGSGDPCPADQLLSVGEVCRPTQGGFQGACDVEETCDGSSPECPPDTFIRAGEFCRAPKGVCDVPEACTGTEAACPPDGFLGPETVCRSAYGVCDVAETCSGSSKDCPEDGFQIGTVCRSSAGACDVAETCSGNDADCPADAHSTAVCRSSKGGCDRAEFCGPASVECPPDEKRPAGSACGLGFPGTCQADTYCDGFNDACPNPAFVPKPQGTICRTANGVCDADDVCNGFNTTCPNPFNPKPQGTVCRPSAGPCDTPEVCDGVSTSCPAVNVYEPNTTVCRHAQGDCDLDDYCTGFSDICTSPDAKKPAFTVCRPVQLDGAGQPLTCDKEEKCDGVSNDCPVDKVQDKFFTCRPPQALVDGGTAGLACDAPERCDGMNKTCPADLKKPLGTTCSKETECRAEGVCKGSCGGLLGATPCISNSDCNAGVTCSPINFRGRLVEPCGAPEKNEGLSCNNGQGTCVDGTCTDTLRNFGESCRGDDQFEYGDPNGPHCVNNENTSYLFKCCAGSRTARTGESGVCQECCNNLVDEFNGGCPESDIGANECCSGRCKDIARDPEYCGGCDDTHNCIKGLCPVGECYFECLQGTDVPVIGNGAYLKDGTCLGEYCPVTCEDGICIYESICPTGTHCVPAVTAENAHPNLADCEEYRDCSNYPVPPGGTCIPRWTCTVSIAGVCQFIADDPLDIECPLVESPTTCVEPDPGNHCGSCENEGDCFGEDECQSSCGNIGYGPFVGLCTEPGYCGRTPDECR